MRSAAEAIDKDLESNETYKNSKETYHIPEIDKDLEGNLIPPKLNPYP